VAIRPCRPLRPPTRRTVLRHDEIGRLRLAERSYVTMKSADYILVAGFERPDIFEMVASGTAWP